MFPVIEKNGSYLYNALIALTKSVVQIMRTECTPVLSVQLNRIQNTAPVLWILVKSNTFLHWVQKVRQIENAIMEEPR